MIGNWFRAVWSWSLANSWRNWAFHAGIAFVLSFIVGAWAAAVFYILAEIQEVMLEWGFAHPIDWKDHAGDAGFPIVAAFVAHVFFGR